MIACVDLPAFPLQLVWRREPALRSRPVAVIDEDRPQGVVLWACERARDAGVLPGQRYAHALSLCSEVRARVVPPEQIEAAIVELRAACSSLSPRVDPSADGEPGTLWLDGHGLAKLFIDQGAMRGAAWATAIAETIARLSYRSAIVIGFSRFGTYAIARALRRGVMVLDSPDHERTTASTVPLDRLELDPKLRDALARLGVRSVGQLVRLPGGGILERFGREAHRLYQLAAGERWDPLIPVAPPEALVESVLFDEEDDNVERLVFALKGPIERLLARLATAARALTALHVELALKHAVGRIELRAECIKPAAPTLDARVLQRLVLLRLGGMPPVAPVNAIRVWAEDVVATREQLALFTTRPHRDLRAANEALAHIRAELGDDAVVRAVLRDGHLPEARFGWERLLCIERSAPASRLVHLTIRRLLTSPRPLAAPPRRIHDDGWLVAGMERGPLVQSFGPYTVSGGWWANEVHREYYFAELRRGDCLWIYFDRKRQRWYWHGEFQ